MMGSISARFRSALAIGLMAVGTAAMAQKFPSKVIEWVVPYPPGGGTDVVARALAQAMADYAARERAKWGPVIRASGIRVD